MSESNNETQKPQCLHEYGKWEYIGEHIMNGICLLCERRECINCGHSEIQSILVNRGKNANN